MLASLLRTAYLHCNLTFVSSSALAFIDSIHESWPVVLCALTVDNNIQLWSVDRQLNVQSVLNIARLHRHLSFVSSCASLLMVRACLRHCVLSSRHVPLLCSMLTSRPISFVSRCAFAVDENISQSSHVLFCSCASLLTISSLDSELSFGSSSAFADADLVYGLIPESASPMSCYLVIVPQLHLSDDFVHNLLTHSYHMRPTKAQCDF